ncbi:MAG: hypothetical protein M0Z82_06010 [Actinomycetota bacterium]|nr:hypothetical protein [Actinomycetota bacterium]
MSSESAQTVCPWWHRPELRATLSVPPTIAEGDPVITVALDQMHRVLRVSRPGEPTCMLRPARLVR